MTPQAWIALAGFALGLIGGLVTHAVLISRHLTKMEGMIALNLATTNAAIAELRSERKSDVELLNVKIGQVASDLAKYERRTDERFRNHERILGRSTNLRELDADEG